MMIRAPEIRCSLQLVDSFRCAARLAHNFSLLFVSLFAMKLALDLSEDDRDQLEKMEVASTW